MTELIQGAMKPLRVLCAREVQLSIRQSVHKLLKDQIVKLGLESLAWNRTYWMVWRMEGKR